MSRDQAFILCRAEKGLDFDSFDEKLVSILFVFLSREKNDLSKSKPILRLMDALKTDKYGGKFMEVSTEYQMYLLLEEISKDKDLGQSF